jgi:hypothetical protein
MALKQRLSCRLPLSIIQALEDEAGEQFLPVSHLIRTYVLQGLAKAGRRCRPDAPIRRKSRIRSEPVLEGRAA